MDYCIQPMAIGDFDEITRLWKSTEGIGMSDSDSREAIADFLTRNPNLSLTARLGDGRLGRRRFVRPRRSAWLPLPFGRRSRCSSPGDCKGFADRCLSALQTLGIQKCSIFVYENNSDGQAFWTHNGWKRRVDLCILQRPFGFTQVS